MKSGLLHYEPGMFRLDWELTSLTFEGAFLLASSRRWLWQCSGELHVKALALLEGGFGAASRLTSSPLCHP